MWPAGPGPRGRGQPGGSGGGGRETTGGAGIRERAWANSPVGKRGGGGACGLQIVTLACKGGCVQRGGGGGRKFVPPGGRGGCVRGRRGDSGGIIRAGRVLTPGAGPAGRWPPSQFPSSARPPHGSGRPCPPQACTPARRPRRRRRNHPP